MTAGMLRHNIIGVVLLFLMVISTLLGFPYQVNASTESLFNDKPSTFVLSNDNFPSSTPIATLLPPPSLYSPGNGQGGVPTSTTFSWSSVSGANKYWLIISTSEASLPSNVNATSAPGCMDYYTTATSYPFSGLNSSTTYYWEVQAFHMTGSTVDQQGQYSAQYHFTTQSSSPENLESTQGSVISMAQAAQYAMNAGFTGEDIAIAVAIARAESDLRIDNAGDSPKILRSLGYPSSAETAKGYNCPLGSEDGFASWGLWQIYMPVHKDGILKKLGAPISDPCQTAEWLSNPANNARAAYEVWKNQGFAAWTMYKNGEYRNYLSDAQQAVTQITKKIANAEPISARIDNYEASPRDVVVNSPTTLSFSFTNIGTEPWTFYAAANLKKPDGTKVNLTPKPVALDPGQMGSATWTYTIDQEGSWDLVYSIWKEQGQINSLGNTGWLLRNYIIGRASDSNSNLEPALNLMEAATIETANLSCAELSALGTAIDNVLYEELKLGSIRKPVLIRAQILAGEAESVGGMFSGFTGFFRKWLASFPSISEWIGVNPPANMITISEETEIAVMFIEEVGTTSLMTLGPVGELGAAIVKILSPVAQWGGTEWATWRYLDNSLLRVTKQGIGTMDVIYSKKSGEAFVTIILEDFEQETMAMYGQGKECLYIFIPFDTEPPNLRKTNAGFDYRIIYKVNGGVNENGGSAEVQDNSQPSDVTSTGNIQGQRIDNVQLTWYTLALEQNLRGHKTGDSQTITNPPNISGTFYKEFLYSGYGVAMQGTGISLDGRYIKYVRGGGGWDNNYTWLNDPASAVFTVSDGVIGAFGRTLTEWQSIAVDPTVIPNGYYVWIEFEQAWFRADDTGGAIKGKHIDIYVGISQRRPKSQYSTIYIQPQPPN